MGQWTFELRDQGLLFANDMCISFALAIPEVETNRINQMGTDLQSPSSSYSFF